MTHILAPLNVDPHDPAALLPELESAIAGQSTFLPLPAGDVTRSTLLRNTQRAGEPISADIALVVPTSGSTGTPKGAQLSPANLVASADATHHVLGGPGQWLLAMPAHHIAGIQVLVRSLVAGVDPLCLDLSAGFSIPEFARAAAELDRTGDRTYTALTPMQLAKAMDSLAGIEALRSFEAILVGGAAINPQLHAAAKELDIHVVTTYGSSETAGGCVYNGRALPGTQVRVESSGRILLGGPTIAHGYRNAPGHQAFAHPGWFATSDSGELDAHGVLTVTGRLDNIIDSGGLKLHPEVLEQEILAVAGVESVCVVGVPHPRLGQAIMAAYTGTASITDILVALEEAELPRWQVPKELKRLSEMPVTGPGKVDRQVVTALLS
ncbi:o-succinylbenzoate--CoA ligase [Corynebacterium sp.]|uniref:o-succinylbenzoate--CoA ligase n=1 Tax=Corynebacterium sp. TaxID=1720 RepID=UPI0026DADE9F|nr:o-succinylbenzoate--CoA ligase [Corynebacterium sp.]MDO5032394.1 o-succinylbenzoate--CoA ligase [Corynebacterium sp.]